jgi:hypothetical protein
MYITDKPAERVLTKKNDEDEDIETDKPKWSRPSRDKAHRRN